MVALLASSERRAKALMSPLPQDRRVHRRDSEQAQQIRDHIRGCRSCRDIAEAMGPALHLIHESMPVAQRGQLPVFLSEDDPSVEAVMQKVRVLKPAAPQKKTASVFGIAALLASLSLVPWFFESRVEAQGKPVSEVLAAMNLPPPCVSTLPNQTMEVDTDTTMESVKFDCCTSCHTVHSKKDMRGPRLSRILLACQSCHAGI